MLRVAQNSGQKRALFNDFKKEHGKTYKDGSAEVGPELKGQSWCQELLAAPPQQKLPLRAARVQLWRLSYTAGIARDSGPCNVEGCSRIGVLLAISAPPLGLFAALSWPDYRLTCCTACLAHELPSHAAALPFALACRMPPAMPLF